MKWIRENLVSVGSPIWVYECQDYKVYSETGTRFPSESSLLNYQLPLFRIVWNSRPSENGWDILKWDWSYVKGRYQYVRDYRYRGYSTLKDAKETVEELIKKLEFDKEADTRSRAREMCNYYETNRR